MEDNRRDLSIMAASELIRKKVLTEKDELSKELADILSGTSTGTIDIRKKEGRELFLRIMFVQMAGSFVERIDDVDEMDMDALIEKMLKVTRQMREEKNPTKGVNIGVFVNSQGRINAIDTDYNAVPVIAAIKPGGKNGGEKD
jgi:hypothetical protein